MPPPGRGAGPDRGRARDMAADTRAAGRGPVTRTATAVSLTGQLTGGELARWCAANLTGTRRLVDEVTTAAAATRPLLPTRIDNLEHWASVEGALRQRLASATQDAPPYYALLGAHRTDLADWATVQHCAARFPTPPPVDSAARLRSVRRSSAA